MTEASPSSGTATSEAAHRLVASSPPGATHDRPAGHPPQTLDRWFDEQLNRLFNDVSSEPLPADLAKLVTELRAQGSKSGDK